MKVRSDFVTNSSSSSFLIAYRYDTKVSPRDPEQCPTCGHKKRYVGIDIASVIERESRGGGDTELIASTTLETIQCLKEGNYEEINEVYKLDEEGYKVIKVEISDHNEFLRTLFEDLESQGTIKRIYLE